MVGSSMSVVEYVQGRKPIRRREPSASSNASMRPSMDATAFIAKRLDIALLVLSQGKTYNKGHDEAAKFAKTSSI